MRVVNIRTNFHNPYNLARAGGPTRLLASTEVRPTGYSYPPARYDEGPFGGYGIVAGLFNGVEASPIYTGIRLTTRIDGSWTNPGVNTLTFVYDYTHTWTRIPIQASPSVITGSGYDHSSILTYPYGGSPGIAADQCVFYLDNSNLLYFYPYAALNVDVFQMRGLGNPKKQLPKIFCAPLPDGSSTPRPALVDYMTDTNLSDGTVRLSGIYPKIEFPTLVLPSAGLLGHRYDMTAKWGMLNGDGYYDMTSLSAAQWRDLRGITFSYSHPGAFDHPYSGGTVATHVSWELL